MTLAVRSDWKYERISNRLICTGLITGFCYRICTEGAVGAGVFIIHSIFPVILLFLLFLMRALGAGDIKLFSIIGGICSFRELIYCVVAAFAAGAVFSLLKMVRERSLFLRLGYFFHYLYQMYCDKKVTAYDAGVRDAGSVIHFSIAIWLGYLVSLGVCN